MRIAVTADLHYNVPRSIVPAQRTIERITQADPDVILLAGDTAGHDLGILRDCLRLFDGCPADKLLVAGNHDLWTARDDSLHRYEEELPAVAEEAGFRYLDRAPFVRDGVGFVGTIGWYDYSYRLERLEIPLRFYEAKLAPGAAMSLSDYRHLCATSDDIPAWALSVGTRWMDGANVHLPFGDAEFTERLVQKLDEHLTQLADEAETIVATVHHLPFRQLVLYKDSPRWDFAAAFMGSERFGEVLLRHDKVRYVFCGHAHKHDRVQIGPLDCFCIGSTYRRKRFEVLEL